MPTSPGLLRIDTMQQSAGGVDLDMVTRGWVIMDDSQQGPAGPFAEDTPRRCAFRTIGAAGAAFLGALGLSAMAEAKGNGKGKRHAGVENGVEK